MDTDVDALNEAVNSEVLFFFSVFLSLFSSAFLSIIAHTFALYSSLLFILL